MVVGGTYLQEAVDSGIDDILIVSGKGKRAIEDHFDRNLELEEALEDNGDLCNEMRRISDMANIHFIRQKELNGLGDAIYYARQHIGNEPFAVLLGDTIIDSVIPVTQQLIDVFDQYGQSVVAVEQVPEEKVDRYGIVGGSPMTEKILELNQLIEKPAIGKSPSTLAIAGRYILTPEIFKAIEQTPTGKNGEVQLTDAMCLLLKRESIYSYTIEGQRYDIGNKLDYLKTTVEFALRRKEFAAPFLEFLKQVLSSTKAV